MFACFCSLECLVCCANSPYTLRPMRTAFTARVCANMYLREWRACIYYFALLMFLSFFSLSAVSGHSRKLARFSLFTDPCLYQYAYAHTHIRMHTRTRTHTHMHTHMHTRTRTAHAHMHMHMHVSTLTCGKNDSYAVAFVRDVECA